MFPRLAAILLILAIAANLIPLYVLSRRYPGVIYSDPRDVPPAPVAIVFGAGVQPSGELSWIVMRNDELHPLPAIGVVLYFA